MKKAFFLLYIFMILSLGGCILANSITGGENMSGMNELLQGFPGRVAGYEYIDRALMLSSFSDIELGDSYSEIVDKIGKPNGMVGSGLLWPYYQLIDSSCVTLYFARDDKGEFSELFNICITDVSGRTYELKK